MVRLLSISNSPLVSPMAEPESELVKVMVPPGQRSTMAWRSEPGPASLVFSTVMFVRQVVKADAMV